MSKHPLTTLQNPNLSPYYVKSSLTAKSPGEGFVDELRSNHQASAISAEILPGHRTKILKHNHAASCTHIGESTTCRTELHRSRHYLRSRFQINIFNKEMRQLRSRK